MKFYLNLFCICCILNTNTLFAFAICKPCNIEKPGIIKFSNYLKASEFVILTIKDFSLITGKKLNLWNRLSFSILKIKLRHDLKKDPKLNVNDYFTKKGGRHLSIWIILLSIVGVLLILFLLLLIDFAHHGP